MVIHYNSIVIRRENGDVVRIICRDPGDLATVYRAYDIDVLGIAYGSPEHAYLKRRTWSLVGTTER